MKTKRWPIYIWFLDDDLEVSASYLTDKALLRSIDGCIGAIVSTIFYTVGIRTKKFYDYYFNKENSTSTMTRFFPNWPLHKKPTFAAYNRRESKWCKSCGENFDYCKSYLDILFREFEYREGVPHESYAFMLWLELDAPHIDIAHIGIEHIYLPWKVVEPKHRRQNIVDGYRQQFMASFENDDPFAAYGSCKRDIPRFVLEHFNGEQAFES